MKHNLSLCLKLMLSLSFIGQNIFANPVDQSRPACPAASVPVTTDANVDILLKPNAPDNPAEKILGGDTHYTITLSEGNGPQDDDVLITRRIGRVYNFRYCKAHDPGLAKNPIDQIKRLRFSNPNIFRNQKGQADMAESDKLLDILFNSEGCDKTRDSSYALIKIHDVKNHTSDQSITFPSWMTGIGGAGGLFLSAAAFANYKASNNTLGFFRRAVSKPDTVWSTVTAIALLGAGIWYGHDLPSKYREAQSVNSAANASYAFVYGPSSGSTNSMETSDIDLTVEYVVPSMAEFKVNFDKGLSILLNDRSMTRF